MSAPEQSQQNQMGDALELFDDQEQIRDVEARLLKDVERHNYPEASVFAIRLAYEEAVLNGLRHGHKDLPGTPVRVWWSVNERMLKLQVADQGPGFKQDALPDPTSPERLELPHGRGVMLIRCYMTRVSYNESGNEVTMEYDNPELANEGECRG